MLESDRFTGAVRDRLTDHVRILEMNGNSLTFKQSKRRIAADQLAQQPR